MNRKVMRVMELCLAVVLAVSLVMVIRTRLGYAEGASVYNEAAAAAELPELTAIPVEETKTVPLSADVEEEAVIVTDPNLISMARMDLNALREENSDVLGWITIPETELSYPLLQTVDNDYYLIHSWKKKGSNVGAIFMDFRSSADLTDFNTVIYGHRMRNGSMFASLKYFNDQEHWRTHPSVYLACFGGVYRYDIFAAYEASVGGSVYDFSERDEEDREAFIGSCLELSVIDTGIVPAADDHILTLSTCTGNGYANRWVVQAVLAEFMPVINTP